MLTVVCKLNFHLSLVKVVTFWLVLRRLDLEEGRKRSVGESSGDKESDEKKNSGGDFEVDKKSDEVVVLEGKANSGESCKGSNFSAVSIQPSMPEEEGLGSDERILEALISRSG